MSQIFMIQNARVSFFHGFKPSQMGSYGASLMLDQAGHKAILDEMNAYKDKLVKENLKGYNLQPDKIALRYEGNGRPEYKGVWVLSATGKPVVIDASGRNVITSEEDCPIYSGCRVNAKVDLWAQDNKHGKRVNCKLLAIQFAGDDEALDSSYIAPEVLMEGFGEVAGGSSFLD